MTAAEDLARILKERDDGGCMVAFYPRATEASEIRSQHERVPGIEPASQLHVTLAYLGKACDVPVDPVHAVVAGWAAATPPIGARLTGSVSSFGNRNGEDPAQVALVSAPALDVFRPGLVDALARAGVPARTDYSFNPHMTIAYGPDELHGVEERELEFSEVWVVHGGRRRGFSLTGQPLAKSVGSADMELFKGRHKVPNKPGKTNWVQEAGGLPPDIENVAGAILDDPSSGIKDTGRAIATAVSRAKVWCAKGNAKYCKAVAQWEKLKAKAAVKKDVHGVDEVDAVLAIPHEERVVALAKMARDEPAES